MIKTIIGHKILLFIKNRLGPQYIIYFQGCDGKICQSIINFKKVAYLLKMKKFYLINVIRCQGGDPFRHHKITNAIIKCSEQIQIKNKATYGGTNIV